MTGRGKPDGERLDGAAVAAAFGLGTVRSLQGPVARGEEGQIWRLVTERGTWAVKESFDLLEPAVVAEAAAFQEAATRAGISTPAVVRAPGGDVVLDRAGTHVRVYEWVDLQRADRGVAAETVGRLLASIHRLGFESAIPLDYWYTDPVGEARWRELAAGLTAARGPHAEAMATLCDELVALEELLEPPRELVACHRDLWADNVLPTPDGDLVVIDWDNCGLADPSQELALVLCEFTAGDATRTRALYDAYRDAGGPGRVSRPADFSMVVAQLGHIGEMTLATWLDPGTAPAERERQTPRIEEFVTLAVTRDVIDGILAAVADR